MLRLYQLAGAATTRFAYDGLDAIAEYNGSNTLQRRFVHGPGMDEPIAWYEGSGTTDRRFLSADERGSIIANSDTAGNVTTINRYDEYGKPQATNVGRFQYTGQMWIGELGLYHYKARAYAAHLGRFLQSDPAGGINLYAYVGGDPVNFIDPTGLWDAPATGCLSGPSCGMGNTGLGLGAVGTMAGSTYWVNHDMPGEPGVRTSGSLFSHMSDLIPPIDIPPVDVAPDMQDDIVVSGTIRFTGFAFGGASLGVTFGGSTDPLDDIVVTGRKLKMFGGIPIDFSLRYPEEQKWLVYPGLVIQYFGTGRATKQGSLGVNRFGPHRPGYIAIIHTHPRWAWREPEIYDYGYKVPVYGITPAGVFKIPAGSINFIWISN